MKITFLGTGTSQGVPLIGCDCATCKSSDPKDRRTRASILIEDGVNVLIDTAPDFWSQAIRENLRELDAVIFTHGHADHIMGFDDLRRFCEISGRQIPIYGAPETLARLKQIFFYAFEEKPRLLGYVHAEAHEIHENFKIGNIEFSSFALPHGDMATLGFVFTKDGQKLAAYFCDCKKITDEAMQAIENIPVLIIDALRDREHPGHLTTAEAIAVSQKVRAKKTYLTHLTHQKTYAQRQSELPENIFLSYDGLKLDLE